MIFGFRGSHITLGCLLSLVGHVGTLFFVLTVVHAQPAPKLRPTIYSVTLEGGKKLGGIAQVPKEEKKTPVTPPKKTQPKPASTPKPKQEDKQEDKNELEEPEKPEEDADVSLATPTAQQEEKPTPKPKATPKPTPKLKPTPKPRPKPKPKATPKKTPPKPKEPSVDELNKRLQRAVQRYVGESTDAGGEGFGAGRLGGNRMGGGVVRPPEFFVYKETLERSVKSGWHWHDSNAALIAQIEFTILPDGRLTGIELAVSSGNPQYDQSVVRAVSKASPVPPPPSAVYQFFRRVRMFFDPRD